MREADALDAAGEGNAAVAAYVAIVERFEDVRERTVKRQVDRALAKMGLALLRLQRLADADAVFDKLCGRARVTANPEVAIERAQVLIGQILARQTRNLLADSRIDEAIAMADALLRRFGDTPPPGRTDIVIEGLRLKASALAAGGRREDAVLLLEELNQKYEKRRELPVQQAFAKASILRAELLQELDRPDAAFRLYEELARRLRTSDEPLLREQLAIVLRAKALALRNSGDYRRALDAEDELIDQFGCDPPQRFPYLILEALVRKGSLLLDLDSWDRASALYGELVQHYGGSADPHVQGKVAESRAMQTWLQLRRGRNEEAIASANEFVSRFGQSRTIGHREYLSGVLNNKALALGRLGRWMDAVALDDEVVLRFRDDTELALREAVARALAHRAYCYRHLGRLEDAIDSLGEVVERFGAEGSSTLSSLAAGSLMERTELLALLGRGAEAMIPAEAVISRGDGGASPDMIARSLRVKAEVLAGEDRYQEAIESLDDLVERFDGVGEPEIRRQVASALCNRVLVLEGMGNQEEALTAHSDMVSRFGEEILSVLEEQVRLCAGSELLRVREQLAATLLSQARVLVQLDRAEQAQSTLLMLIGQFEDDADPRSQSAVTSAREMLDEMIQSE